MVQGDVREGESGGGWRPLVPLVAVGVHRLWIQFSGVPVSRHATSAVNDPDSNLALIGGMQRVLCGGVHFGGLCAYCIL